MSSAGNTETGTSQSVAFAPGTLVLSDRFRIVRLLGRGGMGLVYAAEQVSLGRMVAIKVLRGDVSHADGFAERFRREALLLSSVEHPAVVRVIDYGEHAGAQCLVMEFVEGESLEVVLQREAPLSVERVELLLGQLAQGLAAIHAKGIVHRDLKPENVLLTRSGEGFEQARLLDFGIARLMDVPGETSSVTQAGMVLGTPEYVSPEQALGQPLDARSDLYSLGVILFRALTGRHPFPGPSPREFISQHIHQAPPDLVESAPHLAAFPGLVAAVSGCLQKEPLHRPQTATALFTLSTSKPLQLTETSAVTPPPATHSRNLKAVGIGAAVGAVLALLLWVFWFNEPTRKAERLVDSGRGSEALQVLDELGEQANAWPLQQLRATALHQVGRHEEEQKLMATFPENQAVSELALEALCDDFGRGESAKLRKLLAGLPKASALPLLQSLAKDDQRWSQWGALRFVDLEYAGQGLNLLVLYANALESKDCGVRRVAARRLVEFRSTDAVPALEKLKALPREKGEPECGQAAADAALKQLARE